VSRTLLPRSSTGILVGLLVVWSVLGTIKSQAQITMPPPTACLANILSTNIPATTVDYVPFSGNTPAYWTITWDWSFIFSCPGGTFNMCQVCNQVEVDYMGANNQWVVSFFVNGPGSAQGSCGWSTNEGYTTNIWLPASGPQKIFQAIFRLAEFDPGISNDCFGQDYQDYSVQTWQIP